MQPWREQLTQGWDKGNTGPTCLVFLHHATSLSTNMPPSPRDIVRVLASVDRTLHNFFYDNSRLSAVSGITGTKKSSTPAPNVSTPPNRDRSKGGPVRPGVVLDVFPDYAHVAVFTTLKGKGLSDIDGLLRHISAAIHPINYRRDPAAFGWIPTLAVYPTWHTPEAAKHSLCLCIKHRVPINELKPWSWKDEPALGGEKFVMCRGDFRVLQLLCERNERLRGLFASDIRWLFEELSLDDFLKRCD